VRLKQELERGSATLVDLETTEKMKGTTCESTVVKTMTVTRRSWEKNHSEESEWINVEQPYLKAYTEGKIRPGQGGRPTNRPAAEERGPTRQCGTLFTNRISA
jgi:hypothetical protein